MKRITLMATVAACSLTASAQSLQSGDIKMGSSTQFYNYVNNWTTNPQITADDNFFVSRQKPRARFSNPATQVRTDYANGQRRVLVWMPVNSKFPDDSSPSALPSGQYDSECFTMWSYIDHWGSWCSAIGQLYGGFVDVAHKNGVGVSGTMWVDENTPSADQAAALNAMALWNTDDAARNAVNVLAYFGNDGIGYNSEFSTSSRSAFKTSALQDLLGKTHPALYRGLKSKYRTFAPDYDLQELIWYDGTQYTGAKQFDKGLTANNIGVWGKGGAEGASLFLNYNWSASNLNTSYAVANGNGRSTYTLYAGLNMQGGSANAAYWKLFQQNPVSLGLWGAHNFNMFWQSRNDLGGRPDQMQATYQRRIENYFTGGSFNPLNTPTEFPNSSFCKTNDYAFHGLSTFTSAKSTLKWDLGYEPFITNFNVGNGRFFNYKGVRQNDLDWYNIGVQDYMPTWRWWWATSFLGKTAPATGLTTAFSWEDAYMGGSALQLSGSTSAVEYLHLYKTSYALKQGDIITLRYKLLAGNADMALALSAEGTEGTAVELPVLDAAQTPNDGEWVTRQFTVDAASGLAGKTLAMIALKVAKAGNVKLMLGELSLTRGTYAAPTAAEVKSVESLRNHYAGIDAKLIFNVPNSIEDKANGVVCYNDDVHNAFYKIWIQETGKQPVLYGITTTWAAMLFSAPFTGNDAAQGTYRVGVQSVNLDRTQESAIAWSQDIAAADRVYTDDIAVSKATITPGESFVLSSLDAKRPYTWSLRDEQGNTVAASGASTNSWQCAGVSQTGNYQVVCVTDNGQTLTFDGRVNVTPASAGRLPQITGVAVNGNSDDEVNIDIVDGNSAMLSYTGREADGASSRGLEMGGPEFGVLASDLGLNGTQSFSVAGWIKITDFGGQPCKFLDIRAPEAGWTAGEIGWQWSDIKPDGSFHRVGNGFGISSRGQGGFTTGMEADYGTASYFPANKWVHFAFVYTLSATTFQRDIYINGVKLNGTWKTSTASGSTDQAFTGNTVFNSSEGMNGQYWSPNKIRNVISLGGGRAVQLTDGGNRFAGVLDDFQVWGKAMTADEVQQSYRGLDAKALPAGVLGYWDFETDCPQAGVIPASGGSISGLTAYYYAITGADTGAQGYRVNTDHKFATGCPYIPAHDFKVTTKPEFLFNGATVSQVAGSDTEGSAKATFTKGGVYTGKVILTNDLGSDTRSFPVITLDDGNGVDNVFAADDIRTYTTDDMIMVAVTDDADYTVEVYALNGLRVAAVQQRIAAGSNVAISFNRPSGVYLIKVYKNNRPAATFKVAK